VATVVDSAEKELSPPEIMTTAAAELDLKGVTVEAAMIGLAHEVSLPDVDLTQVGNTVFVGHRGKKEQKTKMVGRAFNVDTARNFVNNYVEYLTELQNKGITHYSIDFDGEGLVPVAKAVGKRVHELGMQTKLGAFTDGTGYRVFFLLKPTTEKAAA